MADRPFNIISLCAGGGGLDRGAELALSRLGFSPRTVCCVERDAFACEVLAGEMEAGRMAPAAVWSDLRTFDGKPWRGIVHGVIAGIPCQGNSLAGKRLLADDERDLWSDTARILREVQPEWFLLENVYGFMVPDRKGGREAPIRRVLRELAEMGWDAEWAVLPASSVGASHRRERVFVLAHGPSGGLGECGQPPQRDGQPDGGDEDLGNAGGEQRWIRPEREELQRPAARGAVSGERGSELADARRELPQGIDPGGPAGGSTGRGGGGVAHLRANVLPIFAPGPADPRWRDIIALAPSLEPAVRDLADGLATTRREWLRVLGNGVVPLQAAAAIVALWNAMEGDRR